MCVPCLGEVEKKKMTKCDIGKGGMSQRVMSLLQKIVSTTNCINNRIRMTLKVVITTVFLLFNVDDKF